MEQAVMLFTYIFYIMEYASLYFVIFGKRLRGSGKKFHFQFRLQLQAGGLLLLMLCLAMQVFERQIHNYAMMALSFGLVFVIFDMAVKEHIKLWLISFLSLSIMESGIEYFIRMLFHISTPWAFLWALAGINLIIWLFYAIRGRKLGRDAFSINGKAAWVVCAILCMITLLITYFIYLLSNVLIGKQHTTGAVLVLSGGIVICVLIYAMVYYLNTSKQYHTEKEFMERYFIQQKEYLERMIQREQDTRNFRHDVINELLQLDNFCKAQSYDELQKYLQEMLSEIEEIRNRQYTVGNDVADTIINYYLQELKGRYDIRVHGSMPEELRISGRDLCLIVSNLIKNAVEEIETQETGQIAFEVLTGQQYLKIRVCNSVRDAQLLQKNPLLLTAKEDKRNHGFGIQKIKDLAEKNGGFYENKIENGVFTAQVTLKI